MKIEIGENLAMVLIMVVNFGILAALFYFNRKNF